MASEYLRQILLFQKRFFSLYLTSTFSHTNWDSPCSCSSKRMNLDEFQQRVSAALKDAQKPLEEAEIKKLFEVNDADKVINFINDGPNFF